MRTIVSTILAVWMLSLTIGCTPRKTNDQLSTNLALLEVDEVRVFESNVSDSILRFEAAMMDLGKLRIGQEKSVIFRFTNASSRPVVITDIATTCGCTSVEWAKTPVMPSKNAQIRVNYKADTQGAFFKTLSIYCAGNAVPIKIAIRGEVK